jgi:hypothetical protein
MKNTASGNQLMMVAVNCPGYDPTRNDVTNTMGVENSKSCDNCHHWEDHHCNINLFDPVLTSLDQE